LVVPVARLREFETAWEQVDPGHRTRAKWPITALLGPDGAADRVAVEDFNRRHATDGPQVEAVEARVASAAEIESLAWRFSASELYCELPLSAELPALVAAVKRNGVRAKVRTGGVKPEDIPAPEAVLAFVAACAAERLPFKATAGLHHPVRGPAPLTYAGDSPRATMFGYLNVLLAATVLWHDRPEEEAATLLGAERDAGLRIEEDRVDWAGIRITADEIGRTRREFMLAVGSCSFTEPLNEIAEFIASAPVGATRSTS
jgi:hypothetical protein